MINLNKIREILDKERITYMINYSDDTRVDDMINIMSSIYDKDILIKLINLGFYYYDNNLQYEIEK